MNYLGHLYFSKEKPDLMVANLFGDFVKGKDYTYLPKIVQEGVYLHRQIDDFIDRHPKVTELRLQLYKDLPKIAGIAIDLYFDHLLAKQWSQYHHQNLSKFVDVFLKYTMNEQNLRFQSPHFEYPSQYKKLLKAINKYDLLNKYANIDGLAMASKSLSRRVSFQNNLDTAVKVFLDHQESIEMTFNSYMEDAIIRFK